MSELHDLDALSLRSLIRSRQVSPVEATHAVIDRVQELDPTLNAFITTDFERALETASCAEHAVTRRERLGTLHGVPFSVKDLIFTEGVRTTGGSEVYSDFIPEVDDVAVRRLKRAGAILIGKTNLAEFGYGGFCDNRLQGSTRNPLDLDRTPGGSTGGGAAAVAAGMGPFTLGTDGGGSIRIPAAFCGLVGFKPTFGAVPMYPSGRDRRYPGFSSWESVEHVGPLARTVADASLVFDVLAGASPQDRHSRDVFRTGGRRDGRKLRVAWSLDFGYAPVDPDVAVAFHGAISVLQRATGWKMHEDVPGFDDPSEAFWPIVASETDVTGMLRLSQSLGRRYSDYLEESLFTAHTVEELREAHFTRQAVCQGFTDLFQRADVLVTPAVAVRAWGAAEREPGSINGEDVSAMAWTPFAFPMNFAGLPAISLPCGMLPDGSRVSLQLAARPGDDWMLLDAAYDAESALRDTVAPPKLDPRLTAGRSIVARENP